ncbi:hypothetical protein ACQWHJ_24405 [Salmonella enterica subsp. enterica serovar Infantis]
MPPLGLFFVNGLGWDFIFNIWLNLFVFFGGFILWGGLGGVCVLFYFFLVSVDLV